MLDELLGLSVGPGKLTLLQMSLRAVIVFVATLILTRVAHKRFLSKMSTFDAVLGFVLASVLARAINGSGNFFPTLGCGFVLVLLHRFLAMLAFHSETICKWIKGHTSEVVRNGEMNLEVMRAHGISEGDIMEEARLNGQVLELREIKVATLERNGQVSVVPEKK